MRKTLLLPLMVLVSLGLALLVLEWLYRLQLVDTYRPELHTLNDPRLHTATIEYFNEQHERLLDSINPKHGKQAAWIATIEEIDLTEDQILRITGL